MAGRLARRDQESQLGHRKQFLEQRLKLSREVVSDDESVRVPRDRIERSAENCGTWALLIKLGRNRHGNPVDRERDIALEWCREF